MPVNTIIFVCPVTAVTIDKHTVPGFIDFDTVQRVFIKVNVRIQGDFCSFGVQSMTFIFVKFSGYPVLKRESFFDRIENIWISPGSYVQIQTNRCGYTKMVFFRSSRRGF